MHLPFFFKHRSNFRKKNLNPDLLTKSDMFWNFVILCSKNARAFSLNNYKKRKRKRHIRCLRRCVLEIFSLTFVLYLLNFVHASFSSTMPPVNLDYHSFFPHEYISQAINAYTQFNFVVFFLSFFVYLQTFPQCTLRPSRKSFKLWKRVRENLPPMSLTEYLDVFWYKLLVPGLSLR